MNTPKIYLLTLLLSPLVLLGAMFKIQHWPGATVLLLCGLFTTILFFVSALILIFSSKKNNLIRKVLWTIGIVVAPWIVGLIYYFNEIKSK